MSDDSNQLMEKFASAMASDFTTKQESSSKSATSKLGGLISNFNPLTTRSTEGNTSVNDMEQNISLRDDNAPKQDSKSSGTGGKILSFFQKKQQEPVQTKPQTRLEKIFSVLPKEKMYMKALAAFGISALLLLVSLFNILSIITNPAGFVCIFTMAVIAALVGLAMWNGP